MELKTFLEKVKTVKGKSPREDLMLSVLQIEEHITEVNDKTKLISRIGEVLKNTFINFAENKVDINNPSFPDLDLDNWKNQIQRYRLVNQEVTSDVYLYVLRNTTKNFIQAKDEKFIKAHLLELAVKTFLYIDYLNLSIDVILEKKVAEIEAMPKHVEVKREPVKREPVREVPKETPKEEPKEEVESTSDKNSD